MRFRTALGISVAVGVCWAAQVSRAGVIHYAGKALSKGCSQVTSAVANGGGTVADAVGNAGAAARSGATTALNSAGSLVTTAGSAVTREALAARQGAGAVARRTVAASIAAVEDTKAGARKLWKVLW